MRWIKMFMMALLLMVMVQLPLLAAEAAKTDVGNIIGQMLLIVLIPIAGIVGTLVAKLLKKYIARIDNASLREFAYIAVRWVEQKYAKASSAKKFRAAYEKVASKIDGVGASDIETAIEAAVNSMNAELGKEASPSMASSTEPAAS